MVASLSVGIGAVLDPLLKGLALLPEALLAFSFMRIVAEGVIAMLPNVELLEWVVAAITPDVILNLVSSAGAASASQ